MNHFDLRRDGFVLALLVLMVVLLVSALAGSYRAFGYALVVFLGMLTALGFVRRGDPVTWVPPVLVTTVLLVAFAGMFTYETAAVHDLHDTLLGFQKGTAFLIYGVWIPAFFTMGVTFALVFDRLTGHE
jgi:O-antigen ligase